MNRCARIALVLTLFAGVLHAVSAIAAVPVPGLGQTRPIAIVGATIHPVSGPVIPNGTIVFADGKIVAVGTQSAVTVPADAERVEGTGRHVYPGLFDPYTRIGLTEIGSVRATNDYAELEAVAPNVSAQVAFHPESEIIPVTRTNGVLLALIAPIGGVLSGQASVMMLDGWTWADMTLASPVAMHVNWPAMVVERGSGGTAAEDRQRDARDRALGALKQSFADARAYWQAKRGAGGKTLHGNDQRWEAMIPVLERRLPLLVSANEVHQIEAAVAFAAAESLKLVIHGGYDAPFVARLLVEHDVPVIVSSIYRLPARRAAAYDDPYTLPERLRKAGVRFAIGAGANGWNDRNLPYHAATAAAYGLPAEDALRAITLSPAEILGVANRVGSLEPGKDATLFVSNGDVLEEPTQVERAYIQGRNVDLSDKQKVLYDKYREKYRRLGLSGPEGTSSMPGASGSSGGTNSAGH
ncbi:MAG: amidohydrolase family protein [Candidatus Eiseniibacteriota bacterium]